MVAGSREIPKTSPEPSCLGRPHWQAGLKLSGQNEDDHNPNWMAPADWEHVLRLALLPDLPVPLCKYRFHSFSSAQDHTGAE